jgi:hypothetical protein
MKKIRNIIKVSARSLQKKARCKMETIPNLHHETDGAEE